MRNLYVGFGELYFSESWLIVNTAQKYKDEIINISNDPDKMYPNRISFDNDIDDLEIEGYHLLKWTLEHYENLGYIERFLENCELKFHTANSINLPRMQGLLQNYKKHYGI